MHICNNVTFKEKMFPKQKLYDNNYLELYSGQLDFYRNASLSRAPTWSRNFFSSYAFNSLCI